MSWRGVMRCALYFVFIPLTAEPAMTWFNVTRCVMTELFPVLSITMQKCIEEKLSKDPRFKVDDFGESAVKEVIERLRGKRTMNNKEISYLKERIQRASGHREGLQRLVDTHSLTCIHCIP